MPSPHMSRSGDCKSNVRARLGPRLARTPSPEPDRRVSVRERGAARSIHVEIKEERPRADTRRRDSPQAKFEREEKVSHDELKINWFESCEKIAKSDEEFKNLINSSKDNVDLRLIDKVSEERKKLQKSHKKIKKQVKGAYKDYAWQPTSPLNICQALKDSNFKPSFVIDNIFRDEEDTKEFFGKFGTLANCQTLDKNSNKVKIEFFHMKDAVSALTHPKHPRGVSFFADPFPEIGSNLPIKPEPDTFIKNEPSLLSNLSRDEDDIKVKLEDVDRALKLSLRKETSRRRKPILKIPAKHKIDTEDFHANNDDVFAVIIDNSSHFFKTEPEVFDYFVQFGTLSSMHYLDGNILTTNLDPHNKIVANFEAGHSLWLAVNTQHEADIEVTVAEDCLVRKEFRRGSGDSPTQPRQSRRKRSRSRSPKLSLKRYRSRSPRDFEEGSFEDNQTNNKTQRRKNAKVPQRHSDTESWECPKCHRINKPRDKLTCFHCKALRPGSWFCHKCDNINYPDQLRCHKRACQEIRRGNWICPDPDCQFINWRHSIQCFREGCYESQPGSWLCRECDVFNWKVNETCFLCNDASSNPVQAKINFEFNAEAEKRRQAQERVRQQQQPEIEQLKISYCESNSNKKLRRHDQEEESGTDWHRVFDELGAEKKRKAEDEKEKARVVQNRLLALVGQTSSNQDPSPDLSVPRQIPDCVNIDTTDDEVEEPQTQPQPSGPMCRNPNLEPIGIPRKKQKSKIEMRREVVGLMDDDIMEKLQTATEDEQDKILKQFNIVRVEPPKRKVVEIDLFDSDDDDDDQEGERHNVEGDSVAEARGEAAKSNDKTAEEIVADIVRKDLESLGGNKPSAFTETEKNCDDGSDIVILD